jgi:mRNA-degrading endonuclease YafQ of YafQ-DinJ toxin-antitoxin module
MIELSFSSSFLRTYQKKIKGNINLEEIFNEKLKIFLENPFDTRLKTHKLSGKLDGIWSFSISFQLRVTFYFAGKNKVIFEYLGTHNEVY